MSENSQLLIWQDMLNNSIQYNGWRRHFNTQGKSKNYFDQFLMMSVVGQSGYGKSSLLNRILGHPNTPFMTDDVEACTQDCQAVSIESKESLNQIFLVDLPGYGESSRQDQKHLRLIHSIIKRSACVLFVLRADKRDHSLDLDLYDQIQNTFNGLVLFVINCIDKIEPIGAVYTGTHLNPQQRKSLFEKMSHISDVFKVDRSNVIPVSSKAGWSINDLKYLIREKLRKDA